MAFPGGLSFYRREEMDQTDVVVIGSGGAGLIAAIASAKEGVSVSVLSKTATGSASATEYSSGFFTLPDQEMSSEKYLEHVRRVGKNLSREDLLGYLGESAYPSLQDLCSWGVTLRFLGSGHATVTDSARVPIASGGGMLSELKNLASGHGVKFVENVFVTDLLASKNRVFGVDYCDWTTGSTGRIFCKSVIIATGGAGQIFSRTDSPSRITGDGYALALKAGLVLEDMEFVQFYPLGFNEPRFPCWMIRLPVLDIARLTDGAGNEFLKQEMQNRGIKDGMEVSLFARDMASRLIQERIDLGDEALLHLEDIERACWDEWDLRKTSGCYPQGVKPWDYGPVHVSPLAHYFCGGVKIDNSTATSIDGLFACGEVTGGVDGANRVGGNALSSMVTFGIRAGREAAKISLLRSPRPFTGAEKEKERYFSNDGVIESRRARNEIRCLNLKCLGPLREERSIRRAISVLENYLLSELPKVRIDRPQDFLEALELESMLLTSLSVAYSALSRKESRGVHYRTDFSCEREEYGRSQAVKIENGRFLTAFVE